MVVGKCWQRCWNIKVIRHRSELWETPDSGCQEKYQKIAKIYLQISKNMFDELKKEKQKQIDTSIPQ